jgi:hypothetical protein
MLIFKKIEYKFSCLHTQMEGDAKSLYKHLQPAFVFRLPNRPAKKPDLAVQRWLNQFLALLRMGTLLSYVII